jgi:hypothetical protein
VERVEDDELLALRLERMAQWHPGLRHSEQDDLREAAQRLRLISELRLPELQLPPASTSEPAGSRRDR